MEELKRSYIAIIPADVRYDETLCANAKLMYGEISALANERGYCWASNAYFAKLYNKSKDSISRWISDLERAGYITVEVSSLEGNTRKLYLNLAKGIGKNADRVSAKKPKGVGKNAEHNSIDNNILNNINNNKENKKFSEPSQEDKQDKSQKPNENDLHRGDALKKVAISAKDAAKELGFNTESTLVEAFQLWLDYKKESGLKPYKSLKSAGIGLKRLKRISEESRCTALDIVEQSIAETWKSLWHLKRDKSQQNGKTHYQLIPEEYGPQPF